MERIWKEAFLDWFDEFSEHWRGTTEWKALKILIQCSWTLNLGKWNKNSNRRWLMTVFKANVMTPCRYLSTELYGVTLIYIWPWELADVPVPVPCGHSTLLQSRMTTLLFYKEFSCSLQLFMLTYLAFMARQTDTHLRLSRRMTRQVLFRTESYSFLW